MRPALALPLLVLLGCAPPPPPAPVEPDAVLTTPLEHWLGLQGVRGLLCHHADKNRLRPALLLIHGDYGLTEWEAVKARQLAQDGYVVLAIDLYRGEPVTDLLDAHIMERGLPENRVAADLKAAVNFLAAQPGVRRQAIGVLGWDIGGGYALEAAIHDPRLRAVVLCYGRLTTDPALLAPLQAPVLGIFAGKDEGISPETIAHFRAAMNKAGKRIAGIHVYPDCRHGFLNPAGADPLGPPPVEAVADAWTRIDAFLAAELKR